MRTKSVWPRTATALAVSALVAMVTGCASFDRELKEPTPVDKFPSQMGQRAVERSASLDEGAAAAESSIQVDETSFMVRAVKPQRVELPDFYVHNMSATESGVTDALQLMLEGSGLTLNIEGGPRGMERFGASSIQNVRGGIRTVLDTLSSQIGFFWSASNGTLSIEPDQMFVVELPPVLSEDSLASMANTMQHLGARDTYLDRMTRTLVFRANRKALAVLDQYLEGVRGTRSLLVYEVQVYQVDLTDGNQQGISWSAITGSSLNRAKVVTDGVSNVAADLAKTFALTASGAGMGAVLLGPQFSVDALVQFLKTQGSVKTVSQPRLAMLNGSKGMLRVGQTTTYVSKVGSNLAGTGISQVTVETKDLHTGLELGLTGEEHDGTIYTRVSLSLSELVRFNKYTTLGTELKLPDVTDRELRTAIRMPAGYTALMGGITIVRESDDRQNGIQQTGKTQEVKRSEIVMVMKPTIVRFKKRAAEVVAVKAPDERPLQDAGSSRKTALFVEQPAQSVVLNPVLNQGAAPSPAAAQGPQSPIAERGSK